MNRDQLNQKIAEYLATQPTCNNEWWGPVREHHEFVLNEFVGWLFQEDIAKEQRRKQWEELNKEFGSQS